jgi:hypothetical protein
MSQPAAPLVVVFRRLSSLVVESLLSTKLTKLTKFTTMVSLRACLVRPGAGRYT